MCIGWNFFTIVIIISTIVVLQNIIILSCRIPDQPGIFISTQFAIYRETGFFLLKIVNRNAINISSAVRVEHINLRDMMLLSITVDSAFFYQVLINGKSVLYF